MAKDLRREHPKIEREIARARLLGQDEPAWKTHADLLERLVDEMFAMQGALDKARAHLLSILGAHEEANGPVLESPEEVPRLFRIDPRFVNGVGARVRTMPVDSGEISGKSIDGSPSRRWRRPSAWR